jgi:hypothetical protein
MDDSAGVTVGIGQEDVQSIAAQIHDHLPPNSWIMAGEIILAGLA